MNIKRKIYGHKVGNSVLFDKDTFFGVFIVVSESFKSKNERPFKMKSIFFRAVDLPDHIFILNDKDTYDVTHPRRITTTEFLSCFKGIPTVQKYELKNTKYEVEEDRKKKNKNNKS